MTNDGLAAAQQKMTAGGVGAAAIDAFTHYYRQLEAGQTGIITEESIEPLPTVARYADLDIDPEQAVEALGKTVYLKLNGGLGTSMGLAGPKALLPVRDGRTFLDLVVAQVLATRARYGVRLPLLLMHSFATRDASLAALAKYPDLPVDDLPLDFLQSREPKLLADTLAPVDWPDDPELEWCPPGHGDIYPSMVDSGVLDKFIAAGFRYAAVSNSDNLGAAPDPLLAGWFASTGAPFAMEVCRRTVNDRKGGHLAIRRDDGHIVLRESAQTADQDMTHFTDENRHPWFNTNNLWLDLGAVRAAIAERGGVLGLPLIRNLKNVDPRDPGSPEVIQIETAMGAAIEVFETAQAIEVERERFVPVKKTNELLLLRSDCYDIDAEAGVLAQQVADLPEVDLDAKFYAKVDDFEQRIPQVPSMVDARSLRVRGDVSFGAGVKVVGDVEIDTDEPQVIADGTELGA